MKVLKNETQFGTTIIFEDENKFLRFTFGGNGDLYWSIHSKNGNNKKLLLLQKKIIVFICCLNNYLMILKI